VHRYTDENGLQMGLDLDDRGWPAGIRAVAALTTVGLGAVAWVIAFQQMNGMDTMRAGPAERSGAWVTGPDSFASFTSLWVLMVAAMMLPGAARVVFRQAYASDSVRHLLLFVGSYLAVWVVIGVAIYAVYSLYRPHGSVAAGALVIAAGVYEFTPLKQHFRRRCGVDLEKGLRSGVEFGLYCVGSSIGLMLMQLALGVMSVTWMYVIGVLMLAQKVFPAKAAFDVPLALAIVGLGILIVVAPSSVPGFMPPV
jgi:predicted metal-binding membrane protein